MKVGTSGSSVAAGTLGRKVALFFDGTSGLPGVLPLFVWTYGLSYQIAEWTTIPLAVVQTADDNCSNQADLTNVPRWIQYANLVYAPLLIEYNRSLDRTICDKGLQGDSFDNNVATTHASEPQFQGRVVVYFRARASGGAFSGASLNFVAMPETLSVCDARGVRSFNFFNNDLAHEVGHYFGLPHPFHDFPHFSGKVAMSKAQVQQMLEDSGFDVTEAFDRDLAEAGVGDTPPDPLYESGGVSDEKCTAKDTPVTLSGAHGEAITLIPPRTNVMSYYQISGTIVNSLTPGQRSVIYRYVRSKLGL
jgi:hypothetical protein